MIYSHRPLVRLAAYAAALGAFCAGPVVFAQTTPVTPAQEFATAQKLAETGDPKGAEVIYTKLIGKDPATASYFEARARARFVQGQLDLAVDDLDNYISLEPRDPLAYSLRAEIRVEMGPRGYASALNDAHLAIRLSPAKEWGPLLFRGLLYQLLGRYPEAVSDCCQVLLRDPENLTALFFRAESELAQGNAAAAQTDLARVAEAAPDAPAVSQRLGEASFRLMQFGDAATAFARSAGNDAKSGRTYRGWGLALLAAGNYAGAIEQFQAALAVEPASNARPQLMIHLAQRRAGKPAGELKAALPAMEQDWSRQIARFLVGEVKDEELMKAAEAFPAGVERTGRTCEAYYYIGQARLLAGDRLTAQALFKQAVATDARTFDEFTLARAELAR